MSKQGDERDNTTAPYYDDTGRGKQSAKVHNLLARAKLVIARENKKLKKDEMKLTGGGKSAFAATGNAIL